MLKPMALLTPPTSLFMFCFNFVWLCIDFIRCGLTPTKENIIQPSAGNAATISFPCQAAGREIQQSAPSELTLCPSFLTEAHVRQ